MDNVEQSNRPENKETDYLKTINLLSELLIVDLCHEAANEYYKPNSLVTKETFVREIIDSVQSGINEYFNMVAKAYSLLLDLSKEEGHQKLSQILPKLGNRINESSYKSLGSMLEKKGFPLKKSDEIVSDILSEEDILEASYLEEIANGYFAHEKIDEAFALYSFLFFIYPEHSLIAVGCAQCMEIVKGGEAASQLYTTTLQIVNHPYYYLSAADFFLRQEKFDEAEDCLEEGKKLISEDVENFKEYDKVFSDLADSLKNSKI